MNPFIRDVFERTPQSSTKPMDVGLSDRKTGFPVPQLRRKAEKASAFKRTRQQQLPVSVARSTFVSGDTSSSSAFSVKSPESLLKTSSDSNDSITASADTLFAAMSEHERAQGREEILEHFGPGIVNIMKNLEEVRSRRKISSQPSDHEFLEEETSTSKTRRPQRRIRFVDPTESDIHVYEPSPSSPRKPVGLLLPAPESLRDGENIHSIQYSLSKVKPSTMDDAVTPMDDTPEAIHARFFPSEPSPENNPSLAWMLPQHAADQISPVGSPSIRYTLSGTPLSPSEIRDLPTHLGLHHHSSTSSAFSTDAPAGYTLEDLLQLSRSSAPPQRVSALGVLGKIFRNTYTTVFTSEDALVNGIHCSVDFNVLRRDIFDTAAEAVAERGWVGQRAVDVLWEIVVGCTQAEVHHLGDLGNFPYVDLTPLGTAKEDHPKDRQPFLLSNESATFLATIPVSTLLSSMKLQLSNNSSISPTHNAILDILYILCHFEKHAKSIVDPDINFDIISIILESHLTSSAGLEDNSNRKSIRILQALARSHREVAQHLLGPADLLLRYVTTMQDELALNGIHASMLQDTLSFYVSLMRYGFYTSVFSTAHTHFSVLLSKLHKFLLSDISGVTPLITTLLELLETSIVCATNPHQTTPQHDITWSQIEAFGWEDQIFELLGTLVKLSADKSVLGELESLWIKIFHVLAAWAEGAHLNEVRNGEKVKGRIISSLKSELLNGALGTLLHQKLNLFEAVFCSQGTVLTSTDLVSLTPHVELMNSYLRLSLASILPNDHLPYDLLVRSLSDISPRILEGGATSEVFRIITATNLRINLFENLHLYVRHLSTLLFLILRIRFVSDTSDTNPCWIRDALRIVHTLLPGDEYLAQWIIQRICLSSNWEFITQYLPENIDHRCQQRLSMLLPFWSCTFIPRVVGDNLDEKENRYPNLWAKSEEISRITSLHLPSLSTLRQQWSRQSCASIFPLRSTWSLWPLDHLLRSETSVVLKYLPSSWDATEVEVVQTTLWFTLVVQHLNKDYPSNLTALGTLNRAETIFACMKVFMLEHNQGQLETGEIYRDPLVEECSRNLLFPFALRNAGQEDVPTDSSTSDSLELASKPYLGERSPFYQFFTDFLALYDSVSFGNPLFANLLLPPLSLSYPPDYRSLLFGEYGHVLRTINIDPMDVLSHDIKEYLWPIERDARILSCYLNVLFKYTLHSFLRWLVIHHLAANTWPDLTAGNANITSARSAELLKAIFSEDRKNTPQARDILFYHQTREGTAVLPPQCYDRGPSLLQIRIHVLNNCNVSLEVENCISD